MGVLNGGLSAVRGLISFDPMRRIESLEHILSYLLHRLPEDQFSRHLESAPPMTMGHMPNARLYPNREAMLPLLPRGGCVGEVGTWRGDFSERIAAVCQPADYHLFDIDFAPLREDRIRAAFAGRLHKHLGDSAKTLAAMPPTSFDWLYIDGLHSYDQVTGDLAAAHLVLKPGGYVMCNDYTNWDPGSAQPYGVAKAVNELCLDKGYEVIGLGLEPTGFHDLLIRKPF